MYSALLPISLDPGPRPSVEAFVDALVEAIRSAAARASRARTLYLEDASTAELRAIAHLRAADVFDAIGAALLEVALPSASGSAAERGLRDTLEPHARELFCEAWREYTLAAALDPAGGRAATQLRAYGRFGRACAAAASRGGPPP